MRLRKVFVLLAAILLLAGGARAADGPSIATDRFDVDWAHSTVGFAIDFMGLTKVDGRFTRYSGTILYDEKDLTKSSVSVAIHTDSINTANDFRDNHLKTADFFDAEKFPYIFFRSTRVEKKGDGFLLIGNLTLKGVTKEVAIPFRMLHGRMKDMWENTRIGFEGRVKIDRRDFGVVGPARWESVLDAGRLTLGREVEIILNIQGRIWNYDRITLPPKHVASELLKTIKEAGVDAAVKQYREWKQTRAADFEWTENGLDTLGYKLLHQGKVREAIEILKLNVEAFPQSSNAYDSLAEANAMAGNAQQAHELYKKAYEMNPKSPNAVEMLRYFGETVPLVLPPKS